MSNEDEDKGGIPNQKMLMAHSERIAIVETRLQSFDRVIATAVAQIDKSVERVEDTTLRFMSEAVKLNSSVDELRRQITNHEAYSRSERDSIVSKVSDLQSRMARKSGEHSVLKESPVKGGLTEMVEKHAIKVIVALVLTLAGVLVGRGSSANPEDVATKAIQLVLKQQAADAVRATTGEGTKQ